MMQVMKPIYFNTVNDKKISEVKELFTNCEREIKFLNKDVMEILSEDIESVIKAKAAEAYKLCRVPVIVEHGALCIDYLNNFPGALSKPMWNLMGDRICDLIPMGESRKAKVLSGVCYCNGITRQVFIEATEGSIAEKGRGKNGFQWDPIFIPNGSTKTYAEMNQSEKLSFSQAAKAYGNLKKALDIKCS